MTSWLFNSGAESWSGTGISWINTDGSPGLGCLHGTVVNTLSAQITGLSIATTAGDPFSLWAKHNNIYAPAFGGLVMAVKDGGGSDLGLINTSIATGGGWFQFSGTIDTSGTVASILVNVSGPGGGEVNEGWFDSIYLNETPPAGPSPVRYLGIAADNANIYRASISGGTLTLDYIALTAPGTAVNTYTFGTCDYADPDSYSRAIYPAVVADKELYLYGRDANGVQVQYNDLNGTLGWINAGPGTASWATTKFCVALMPQPIAPRNLIAAFADDDIWTTVTGSDGIWMHTGDAGTALRTAGRVTTEFDRFLVAGQGTAQTYFSQSFGVSFVNAFSGLAGTVNAFEVSR